MMGWSDIIPESMVEMHREKKRVELYSDYSVCYLEMMGWSDIIPESMVEMHREKKGTEIYSDPEELFNPIAKR